MKFGITFGTLSMRTWTEAALAAEDLGYESVWLPEHLVLPVEMAGSPYADSDHPPVPPDTKIFDAISYLSYVAGRTSRVKLGTYVYLLGIRHPFITARGWATLDIVSEGRAILGAGAGWLQSEWHAVGLDPKTRGKRLDEAIEVCRNLWTEDVVEHHGDHFDFDPVAFEPKPVQQPIPIHIGGESPPALRRVGRLGDGWLGMAHDFASAKEHIATIHSEAQKAGRDPAAIEITLSGPTSTEEDLREWEGLGVTRLIVRPWERSVEAVAKMESFRGRFADWF